VLVKITSLREKASTEVERLLVFLDMTDGFTMSELESTLGPGPMGTDDREAEPEHDEPSLANPEQHDDQSVNEIEDGQCGLTNDREREDEHD